MHKLQIQNLMSTIYWGHEICKKKKILDLDLEKAALQTDLEDILSEITLFWWLFESNIPFFWLRMEEDELKMETFDWIKDIWGRRMENVAFIIENWGWRAVEWGDAIKIGGFHHATPTFNTYISVHPLSRIALFWGHFKALNFPLEDNWQLFPGLFQMPLKPP